MKKLQLDLDIVVICAFVDMIFFKNNLESNILPVFKLHWNTVMTAEMDSSYQKTYKNDITQGSNVNRSWDMIVSITGGGHFDCGVFWKHYTHM